VEIDVKNKNVAIVGATGAVGREFGTSSDDQRHRLVYLGIQLLL